VEHPDHLPISPSLGPTLAGAHVVERVDRDEPRLLWLCAVSLAVGVAAAFVARGLGALIGLLTNLCFYGRLSTELASPAGHSLGLAVVAVPAAGGLVVGLMARFGSSAIRGHGIPEAMEQVLRNDSRIPARLTWLKPLSAAVAIGTGGPFGAEGPIIATGGALGSVVGQRLHTSGAERKTLLAAGAAAGMAATFGTPIAAVLLAVELLLFEFRLRSLVPVVVASAAAAALRVAWVGADPFFPIPAVPVPGIAAMAVYAALGAVVGVASVGVTRAVYAVEDSFARLPVHWMWWPALGGVAVGLVGLLSPRTLGVGYENITEIVSGEMALQAALILAGMKLVSWLVALGSGTSGGTLAPLFTIGGGAGLALGAAAQALLPGAGVDVRVAAVVGMAALFAGASRALLASVLFAFETTLQANVLLPLLAGCGVAYLVSGLRMPHTIMTEKIARRGVRVPSHYSADFLEQISARDAASPPVTVRATDPVGALRVWLASGQPGTRHQGFPVVGQDGALAGVVMQREILEAADSATLVAELLRRPPVVVREDDSLRDAADLMARADVGRLPVLSNDGVRLLGILTRSDLVSAHRRRLASDVVEPRRR
jgi:H+/Cl- antiporter ClcA/CBS domain-containing protein